MEENEKTWIDDLKEEIDTNIKPNNHKREITGAKLNTTLKEMIDELSEHTPKSLSELEGDPTHRTVTDEEKQTWGKSAAIFDEQQQYTNAERLQALANVSNQEAGYDTSEWPPVFTGKMGYVVLQPEKIGDATTTFAAQIANKPNTIFEIRDVYDLDPNNVIKEETLSSVNDYLHIGNYWYYYNENTTILLESSKSPTSKMVLLKIDGMDNCLLRNDKSSSILSNTAISDDELMYPAIRESDTASYKVGKAASVSINLTEIDVIGNETYFKCIEEINLISEQKITASGCVILNSVDEIIGNGSYTASSDATVYIARKAKTFAATSFKVMPYYEIPTNCMLKNNGGLLKNCTIQLNNTSIQSDTPIFGDNVIVKGKAIQESSPEWFVGSDADKIEKAINMFHVVKLAARDYLIGRTIYAQSSFCLKGSGFGCEFQGNRGEGISSSRLIPLPSLVSGESENDRNSILACVYPEDGPYVSVLLSGIEMLCPRNEPQYADIFDATAFKVNGFEICTPGGPSRPIVIENCSFSRLNYGIYAYAQVVETRANISRVLVTGCNISNNNHAIHFEGIQSIGGVIILGNVIEGNLRYGIWMANPEGEYDNYYTLTGYCSIESNLMEGQDNPIYITHGRGRIRIVGNYYEKPSGSVVTLIGKGNTFQSEVYIEKNTPSTNLTITYNISRCVLFVDEVSKKGTWNLDYVYLDNPNLLIGNTFQSVCCLKPNKTVAPLITFDSKANYIDEDTFVLKVPERDNSNWLQFDQQIESSINAGIYVVAIKSTKCPPVKIYYKNPDGDYIELSTSSNPSQVYYNQKYQSYYLTFTLDTDLPQDTTVRCSVLKDVGKFYCISSAICIFSLEDIKTNGIPQLDAKLEEPSYSEIVNPYIGYRFFAKELNKQIQVVNIIDGNAVWKDFNGYTPALSIGTTEQRPTDTLNNGFVYRDTTLKKDITLTLKDIDELVGINVSKENTRYENNIIGSGNIIHILVSSSGTVKNYIEVSFVKDEDNEEDKIELTNLLKYAEDNKSAEGYFYAPDPLVYTKIKVSNNRTSKYIYFTFNSCEKTWMEEDGAIAGVLRSGIFADKPIGSNIYVGFKYFCTDKQTVEGATDGIEIYYKGQDTTDPNNPTDVWVDALGRVVS